MTCRTGRLRVLVVEDKHENRELMSYLLSAFGHEPLVAEDGAAGVVAAARENPDLILMDLEMPRMDGYEAAGRIRAAAGARRTPIVAVTAYAMVGDRDRILASGFDGYISKPIDPEAFVGQVEAYAPIRGGAGREER